MTKVHAHAHYIVTVHLLAASSERDERAHARNSYNSADSEAIMAHGAELLRLEGVSFRSGFREEKPKGAPAFWRSLNARER